jgi:apolipoprotein N-acyltransferase
VPQLPASSWRIGAAAAGGAVLGLAFPPFELPVPLLPVGVALLVLAARGARTRIGALTGFVGGLVFFLVLLRWLTVIGVDAWIGLSIVCAGFFALIGAGTALVTRLPWWPLWIAALWVGVEALRDRVPFGGFPWGRLAFGDETFTFTPLAALAGAPLVTFATALAGALLAYAALNVRERRLPAVAALVGVLAIPLAALVVPTPTEGEPVTVALVQGNVPRSGLDFLGQRQAVLDNHVEATKQLAADVDAGRVPAPDLVIWPENASDIDPFRDASARALIDEAVQAVGVPVLVGVVIATPDGEERLNTGYVWDPVTGPGERYVKRHPVPFGEYVPFRDQLERWVSRLERVPRDYRAGDEPGVLEVGPATLGVVICFEVAYDEVVRDAVRGGGQAIVVQTNNATYGRTGQPDQQALMSRIRAVEHGRPVLAAATSGISQVVAADGTVVVATEEFVQEVVVETVELRTARTLATRVGAWPELALAIVALLAVAVAVRLRRRGEPDPEPEGAARDDHPNDPDDPDDRDDRPTTAGAGTEHA